jgi:AraC-like DNA-binding protein
MTLLKDQRFYKYLTVSGEDRKWGVYLTGAGHINVNKHTKYPLVDDPSHHYFHWSVGRRITEYQILYITKGQGIFESEHTDTTRIAAGNVFILFPNVWHRFKPDYKTGWEEYWVEFNGELIKYFRENEFLNPEKPVISIGIMDFVVENYLKIIRLIKEEKPGYQYIASGILVQILGQIFAIKKYHPFKGKEIEDKIKQAKLMILENMHLSVLQNEFAESVGMGYSLYRKKFKEYTGVSPAQYQIQLRIDKAKDLLITTNEPIKKIAQSIGLETCDYFCRIFKQKTGYTPLEFREKNIR